MALVGEITEAVKLNLGVCVCRKDRHPWDLDRNVDLFFLIVATECFHDTAAKLSCWMICQHTNTEQCVHVKNGPFERMMEAGSEVLMHDCVSVCSRQ